MKRSTFFVVMICVTISILGFGLIAPAIHRGQVTIRGTLIGKPKTFRTNIVHAVELSGGLWADSNGNGEVDTNDSIKVFSTLDMQGEFALTNLPPNGIQFADGDKVMTGSNSYFSVGFENGDLTSGVMIVDHHLGNVAPIWRVFTSDGDGVWPDDIISLNTTSLVLNVSSFVPISGTWQLTLLGPASSTAHQ